ncbi:uncharacterized protein LOC143037456 [Oratosquilla oratoria]|uniref:uncharacterized protein LOC143037456 n=1 Tax=Oratosquilla oratoria TaxID=337810 RepID=UPI003F777624
MRLRGGGGAAPAGALLAAALLALVGTARAKPNFLAKGQRYEHQPIALTQTLSSVEEQQCPNNVLDKWLDEQEPWHILGDLGVEEEDDDGEDAPFPEVQLQHLGEDDLVGQHVEEQEEEDEAVEEKETSKDAEDAITSPVSLEVLGRSEDGLLNPGKDYEVFVLSDVSTTANILLVLDNYIQMSSCGVGGFRKTEGSEDLAPHYSRSPDYLRIGESSDYNDDPSYMPPEGGMNSSINVGECFWWAKGVLVGGDEVSVEYTPPECGCVMLSVYAAFESQDGMLVSGPNPRSGSQSELLCVARTAHKKDEDEDEAEAEEHLVQLQDESPRPQDSTDVVTKSNDLTDDDNDVDDIDEGELVATPQPTESKEKRRKKWRQRIRKNKRRRGRCTKRNWWKCRKNKAARLHKNKGDLEENEVGGGEESEESQAQPHKKNHGKAGKRKRQHKRKKAWRKNHRHHKKTRKANPNKCTRWRRRRGLCKVTEVPEVQDVDTSNETESSQEVGAELRNQDQAEGVNEDLFALLLGPEGDDETILEQEEQEVSETQEGEEEREREGRKLNTKKPLMNQRKVRRMLPPGKKFCCKQGIMMKKTTAPTVANSTSPIEEHLLMTPAPGDQQEAQEEEKEEEDEGSAEEEDGVCLEAPQEVTTWAHYKLKIDPLECETVYKTCCSKFNVEWWLAQRQRKQERKERRKEIFQQRWEKKKEKRKQKKSERKAKVTGKKNKWEAKKAKWNARKVEESHEAVE